MTAKQPKVRINQPAFNFTLSDAAGQKWKMHERRGKIVALLFYPGDETLVCTRQLCSVRDNWSRYLETGAEIVAISPNTTEEHNRFTARHNFPMPLLIDENRFITQMFASHWWMPIWATRGVVVVDAKGIVRYQNVMLRALRPSDDDVLTAIRMSQYDVLVEQRKQHSPKLRSSLKRIG